VVPLEFLVLVHSTIRACLGATRHLPTPKVLGVRKTPSRDKPFKVDEPKDRDHDSGKTQLHNTTETFGHKPLAVFAVRGMQSTTIDHDFHTSNIPRKQPANL